MGHHGQRPGHQGQQNGAHCTPTAIRKPRQWRQCTRAGWGVQWNVKWLVSCPFRRRPEDPNIIAPLMRPPGPRMNHPCGKGGAAVQGSTRFARHPEKPDAGTSQILPVCRKGFPFGEAVNLPAEGEGTGKGNGAKGRGKGKGNGNSKGEGEWELEGNQGGNGWEISRQMNREGCWPPRRGHPVSHLSVSREPTAAYTLAGPLGTESRERGCSTKRPCW